MQPSTSLDSNNIALCDEQWRDVVDFEGIYVVSDMGHVKRIGANRGARVGCLRKPQKHKDGYYQVDLKRGLHKLIHRLVLESFVGPCPAGKEVNHKNGNRQDNRLINLEYVTPKENVQHSIAVLESDKKKAKGEQCHLSKLSNKDVLKIRKLFKSGNYTYTALGNIFDVDRSTVASIVNRDTWKHID